jgi:prolipoprotein diacylglyceryltransferase
MERGDIVKIVVGVLIILFGLLIILFELLFTTDTGLRLFTTQLVSVLIVLAGIIIITATLRDYRNLNN